MPVQPEQTDLDAVTRCMPSKPSSPLRSLDISDPLGVSRSEQMIGQTIGRYEICSYLDSGGMATVFVGRHRFLGHHVAIKLLHGHYLHNSRVLRRFCNEARTVASIEHPGIVRYHDIGRTSAGRIYIVMELLEGETLRDRLQRGPLSEVQTLPLARQIASALAAAHARGVVHRDIKPENVYLVRDPEVPGGERAKVLDFGIAKAEGVNVTAPGALVGTPAYMAPEQCRPYHEVDARADVYSLGALMYRMVTGQPVFRSDTEVGLLRKHLHAAPPSPRARGVDISSGFDEVIRTCLAKRPDERYRSMEALVERLCELAPVPAVVAPAVPPSVDAVPVHPIFDRSHSSPVSAMADGTPPAGMARADERADSAEQMMTETVELPGPRQRASSRAGLDAERPVRVSARPGAVLLSSLLWLALGGVGAVALLLLLATFLH